MAIGNRAVVTAGAKELDGLSFLVDPAEIAQPILRPVRDYWERKRGARPMPPRHEVEPAELKAYLRNLFLIEPLPGAEFRYRLLGSEITDRYGRNSTGKTVRETYAQQPAIADWYTALLQAVTTCRRPVFASGTLATVGKGHVLSEAVFLPLSDDGASVTMIFGAVRYSVSARGASAPRS